MFIGYNSITYIMR